MHWRGFGYNEFLMTFGSVPTLVVGNRAIEYLSKDSSGFQSREIHVQCLATWIVWDRVQPFHTRTAEGNCWSLQKSNLQCSTIDNCIAELWSNNFGLIRTRSRVSLSALCVHNSSPLQFVTGQNTSTTIRMLLSCSVKSWVTLGCRCSLHQS